MKKSKEDIKKMSVDEFCDYMEEWDKATEVKWDLSQLHESTQPKFSTKEDARAYYKSISFDEFEQKIILKDAENC